MAFIERRRHNLKASAEEIEKVLESLAHHFSLKWLTKRGSHPLQKLWERTDELATHELYFFGTCLLRMYHLSPKFVKKQISHIKSDTINNQLGAFFEIIGLGILNSKDQITEPTKGNNPGFDGIIHLSKEKDMRISLKNYGLSSTHRQFLENCKKLEKLIVKGLKERKISPIQIVIDSPFEYPSDKSWESLFHNFPIILDQLQGDSRFVLFDKIWMVMWGDLIKEKGELDKYQNSYTLIVSSVLHKNERKNLFDKIDSACNNLLKHSDIENDQIENAVFIHLPESASILQCEESVKGYFELYPDKPITLVILFQPTVATDFDKNVNFIHHCFKVIYRNNTIPGELKWNIDLNIPVGKIGDPTQEKLVIEKDGKTETHDLKDRYFFQCGNHYLLAKKESNGSFNGYPMIIASGIFEHSVFKLFPDQPSMTFSGKFAPHHTLLIL